MAKAYFNKERCKGCELCTTVCPKNIVSIDKEVFNSKGLNPAVMTDETKCIGCGFCAMMCPDCAIEVR